MPAGMVPYPFAPIVTVQGAGPTLVDLISSDPNINDPQQLTIENSTAAGTPGILFKQTNGFTSGGSPGLIQFNGPDFAGTVREYAALAIAQNFQKTGAIYGDYELNFVNNNAFYNFIAGAVASLYPLPLSAVAAATYPIGTTTINLVSATGWPADGALDLYGFIISTNNGNNLDEEFVHITNKTGTAITVAATKAAHTANGSGTGAGSMTLSILDPTQGPAIYHAPANGSFYSGAINGTNPTPMSLGAGASPWAGIYLNPNLGPEGNGTAYQITKNDFFVIAQKTATYTLPPIAPASSTIKSFGQVVAVFANVGTLTLNTFAATDVFQNGVTTRSYIAPLGEIYIGVPSSPNNVWFPLASIPAL